jgi:hypothetical protein
MPGRKIILHHQPHFLTVPVGDRSSLASSFSDAWVVYRSILQSMEEEEGLSFERLLREINFHFTKFGRASHFAPGFARSIIQLMGASGKRIFDPCCGWGGRLIGAYLENCQYAGCELSPQSHNGLVKIAEFLQYEVNVQCQSCLSVEWPESDLIFTSPPFFDTEHYIGGEQPWQIFKSHQEWVDGFVEPFAKKAIYPTVLYLDKRTLDDFASVRPFSRVIEVSNRRHARRQKGFEYLGIWDSKP